METSNKVHEAIDGFKLPGELKECIRYGSGHINDTYRLTYETPQGTKRYILQRMSKSIFKKPVELMENVSGVTAWLRKKIIENGGDPERETLTLVKSNDGLPYFDGPSHVVLEALRGNPEQLHDHLSYLTRTKDGKILKSTTIYIRDDDGAPIGIFGINYDITLMLAMENAIKQFTATERDEKEPEPIARNVSDLLDELIEQSVKVVGKPVALMNKEDKVKAVQFLNETGAFLITKSGDRVCKFFGISKYTLYSYIDESKA